MSKLFCLATALLLAQVSFGGEIKKLPNDRYSQVETKKTKKDGQTSIEFSVNIADGIKYNWDGPWKLKLSEDGKKKDPIGTTEFKKSLQGDKINLKVSVPSKTKKVDYRLTAFICTKDKKRCFREVHKASLEI